MWLVVPAGVEGELAEEFSGGGVDDVDVEIVDEQDNGGSGVGSPDSDVVESAVDAQGDGSGFVDAVVADPVVAAGVLAGAGGCFGHRVVAGGWGCAVRQRPVRAAVVVFGDEGVQEGLEFGNRVGLVGLGP